jgi:hypothetical protein
MNDDSNRIPVPGILSAIAILCQLTTSQTRISVHRPLRSASLPRRHVHPDAVSQYCILVVLAMEITGAAQCYHSRSQVMSAMGDLSPNPAT